MTDDRAKGTRIKFGVGWHRQRMLSITNKPSQLGVTAATRDKFEAESLEYGNYFRTGYPAEFRHAEVLAVSW